MKDIHEIREMLMNELRNAAEGNSFTFDKLKVIDMLTHSIKSIDTIIAMEESGYSNAYRGNSYNGSYAYNNRNGNSNGNSYYNRRDNRYSRADEREGIIMRMEEMMDEASNDREREAIRKAVEQLKRM